VDHVKSTKRVEAKDLQVGDTLHDGRRIAQIESTGNQGLTLTFDDGSQTNTYERWPFEIEDGLATWTVIGVWLNDEPVRVACVQGRHEVLGDDDYGIFEQGTWATWVEAETWQDAETSAVKAMKEDDT
jgi:hypothetical protein